jgi:hypothetical protein
MGERTETPWELVPGDEHHGPYIVGPTGDVADLYVMSNPNAPSVRNGGDSKPLPFINAEANAAFIVKAVNAHETLVSALREARNCVLGYIDRCDYTRGNAVLAKIDTALESVRETA